MAVSFLQLAAYSVVKNGEEAAMLIKATELRQLDVISIDEGRFLGRLCDVDLDPETGRIRALVVERPGSRFLWFVRGDDLEVTWRDVVLVGEDVILVKNRTWRR